MRGGNKIRGSTGDRIFDTANVALMTILALMFIYPFYYCVILSLNDGKDALNGFIYLWPRMFTLENYRIALGDDLIVNAFFMTVLRTILGTVSGVLYTAIFAYALSRSQLRFRRVYISLGIVSMYFWGGIIPLYLLVRTLGLINNFMVYILIRLSGFFNVLIFMAFFHELPGAVLESAKIDGANEWSIFTRIALPMSTAVIATVGLFYAVDHWNSWIDGYLYITNERLQTLPLILVRMINEGLAEEKIRATGKILVASSFTGVTGNSVRLATMVIAIAPIMCVYPFVQKFFVKGILIGAVKG